MVKRRAYLDELRPGGSIKLRGILPCLYVLLALGGEVIDAVHGESGDLDFGRSHLLLNICSNILRALLL